MTNQPNEIQLIFTPSPAYTKQGKATWIDQDNTHWTAFTLINTIERCVICNTQIKAGYTTLYTHKYICARHAILPEQ